MPGTSNIKRVPNELMCTIFDAFLPTGRTSKNMTPMVLSHVNRRWRELALGMPKLWSLIHISNYDSDILADLFGRSNGLPVDIHFNIPSTQTLTRAKHGHLWNSIILIQRQIFRCRALTISATCETYQLFHRVFTLPSKAPMLASIRLRCLHSCQNLEPCTFSGIIVDHDVLKDVSLHWISLLNADLRSVETLELTHSEGRLLSSMRGSSALKTLVLSHVYLPWAMFCTAPTLTLLKLCGEPALFFFESTFSVPAVRDVEISQLSPNIWSLLVLNLWNNAQHGRFASVKRLVLSEFATDVPSGYLNAQFLYALPSVTHLEFVNATSNSLLQLLRSTPSGWPDVVITIDGVEVTRSAAA
jgi:F-box-like